MRDIFKDILSMDGVHGLVLLSSEGRVLFESLDKNRFAPQHSNLSWLMLIESLNDFEEVDMVFEQGRFYIRKIETGFLMISMSEGVSIAMVKLNCDIVLPDLKKSKPVKA